MITLFLVCMMFDGGLAPFGETGLYTPIRRGDVAVSDSGDVFIVNFKEAHVVRFNQHGARLANIGKKGQGPGEFQNPARLWWSDARLYVLDLGAGKINVYDGEGVFQENYRLEGGVEPEKVAGGWLLSNWRFSRNPNAPIEIMLANNDLSETRLIKSYARPANQGAMMIEANGNSIPKVNYNPARDQTQLAVSPDGATAFLSHPGKFMIDVIDVRAGKVVRSISRDVTLVPFNRDWGLAELEAFKQNRGPIKVDFVPDFPEYFPIVQSLAVTRDGDLVIERYSGDPGKADLAMAIDPTGKDANLKYRPENQKRVMAYIGNDALVSTFRDDEAGLVRVPLNDLDKVVAGSPIEFDGSSARLVMRMD